jgi:hypothetical protein
VTSKSKGTSSTRWALIVILLCLAAVALYRPAITDFDRMPHNEDRPPTMVEGYPCDGWIRNEGTVTMVYVVEFANDVRQEVRVVVEDRVASIYLNGDKPYAVVPLLGGIVSMIVDEVRVALLAVYIDSQNVVYLSACLLGMILEETTPVPGPTLQPLFPTATPDGITT